MKKLLFILIAGVAVVSQSSEADAQVTPVNFNYGQNTHHDTLVDNTTSYVYINTNSSTVAAAGIIGDYEDLGIEFNAKKITGTPGAYAILQSCNDSTLWSNHFGTSADTLTIGNSTGDQTKKFQVGAITYKRYRIKVVPTQSTQTVKLKGSFSVRNKK